MRLARVRDARQQLESQFERDQAELDRTHGPGWHAEGAAAGDRDPAGTVETQPRGTRTRPTVPEPQARRLSRELTNIKRRPQLQ